MTQLHRLSSAFVKSAPYGKHSDGQGLWLIKRTDGGAQWVLRISLGGKRREMGLGSANDVSLKEARELASRMIASFLSSCIISVLSQSET